MAAPVRDPHPAGNVYDKYATPNPVARRLVGRFLREVDRLIDRAAPRELLDVGCGEGIVTARMAARANVARAIGVDRDSPRLRAHWESLRGPALDFAVADARELPFGDGQWDLACGLELIQQLADPRHALEELGRVARRHVLVSVPREPLWRALNVARGAYLGSWGNSPGSVNAFTARGFLALCGSVGEPVAVARPLPWTMVLLRVD
jgi:SAM-dependent methyltransferase